MAALLDEPPQVAEFESLDLAVNMLFLAGEHSYPIARELAGAISMARKRPEKSVGPFPERTQVETLHRASAHARTGFPLRNSRQCEKFSEKRWVRCWIMVEPPKWAFLRLAPS